VLQAECMLTAPNAPEQNSAETNTEKDRAKQDDQ
jgi:hypothetical protein